MSCPQPHSQIEETNGLKPYYLKADYTSATSLFALRWGTVPLHSSTTLTVAVPGLHSPGPTGHVLFRLQ